MLDYSVKFLITMIMRLSFSQKLTTCKCVYLVVLVRSFWFLSPWPWPWPWPDHLDVRVWPNYSTDVSAYQNKVSRWRLSKVKSMNRTYRQTHRQTYTQTKPNALSAAFVVVNCKVWWCTATAIITTITLHYIKNSL